VEVAVLVEKEKANSSVERASVARASVLELSPVGQRGAVLDKPLDTRAVVLDELSEVPGSDEWLEVLGRRERQSLRNRPNDPKYRIARSKEDVMANALSLQLRLVPRGLIE
jgi:hypothetical protein